MSGVRGRWMLAAALMMGSGVVPKTATGTEPRSEVAQTAAVHVEIRQESGEVAQTRTAFGWNEDGTISFHGAGHAHELSLRLAREGQSKSIRAKVAYSRDGQPVIAPVDLDLRLGKREILRIEGGMAIAFTVRANAEKPQEKPSDHEPVERPDGGDVDDPLEGL